MLMKYVLEYPKERFATNKLLKIAVALKVY